MAEQAKAVSKMLHRKRNGPKALALPLIACFAVGACTTSDADTYSRRDVGQIIETSQGRVVSSRPVDVRDENSSLGTVAGGAAGGAIGNTIGSGSGNALATVAGIIIGAGIGYMTERELRENEGVEYLVETEDGRIATIVQIAKAEDAIADGTSVLIQYGTDYTRITPLDNVPAANGGGATGGGGAGGAPGTGVSGTGGGSEVWQNPDLIPEGSETSYIQSGHSMPPQ